MKRDAHALVENPDDADYVMPYTKDDHMRANRVNAVCFRQFARRVAKGGIASKCFHCLGKLIAVG